MKDIKIHSILEFELKRHPMGRAKWFLQRIKETKKNTMDILRK
jgi:hypothetical protein